MTGGRLDGGTRARARARHRPVRGALGGGGPAHHGDRRRVLRGLHGVLRGRAAGLPRHHPRLRDVRTSGRADVARGQRRGAVPTDLRRPMGAAAPARARARGPGRPRVALVEPGPALLGRGRRRAPGAPGRVVGREQGGRRPASPQDRAGMAALLPRCPHHGVGSPLPRGPRAAGPCRPLPRARAHPTSGSSVPPSPTSAAATSPGSCSPTAGCSDPDGDTLRMYYGAADNVVAGASGSLARILARLEA